MRWALCMKNLEVGKMQLITPDMTVDEDDPRFGDDLHIVPLVENQIYPNRISFGVHEFERTCACHPRFEAGLYRNIITHQAAVN
jgi:hypothetical protein